MLRFHAFHTAPILLVGSLVLASGPGATPAVGMPPLPGRGSNSTVREAVVATIGGGDESGPGGSPGATTAAGRRGIAPPTTLAAGYNHTCALDIYGRAWCWGSSQQLGSGRRHQGDDASSPVPVAGGHSFTTLSAAGAFTCGLDLAGRSWCWGESDRLPEKARREPVRVGGRRPWVAIAAGGLATCALDRTRRAWCWGYDWVGQLGDGGGLGDLVRSPVRVEGGHAFTSLSVGEGGSSFVHVCGLDASGRMWCWGRGITGDENCEEAGVYQCFTEPTAVLPSRTFKSLAVGAPCGIDRSGRAWCWKGGGKSQRIPRRKEAPALATMYSSAGGLSRAMCGITPAEKSLCWGEPNVSRAQLGRGQGKGTGVGPVAGDHVFTVLAIGDQHVCGIDRARTAWCWGGNDFGQIGDGPDLRPEWRPVPVAGYHRWMRP